MIVARLRLSALRWVIGAWGIRWILLSIGLGVLIVLSAFNLMRGPSSADDAWIALSAKNLATGKGYSTSLSSREYLSFDPYISTGPVLVLPASLVIHVVGPLDWVPGAVQLAIFLAQIAVLAFLLGDKVDRKAIVSYIALLLICLSVVSARNWYFGALLGEPVAFGFVLIASVMLIKAQSARNVIIAGVMLSLALLSKQISLFAIIGVVAGWLVLRMVVDGKYWEPVSRSLPFLLFGVSLLPISYELWRLVHLGVEGYRQLLLRQQSATVSHAIGAGDFSERLRSFELIFENSYVPLSVAFCVLIISLGVLVRGQGLREFSRPIGRLYVILGVGALAHLIYILCFSTLWTRYAWIGVSMGCAAVLLPICLMKDTRQVCAGVLLMVIALSLGWNRLDELYLHVRAGDVAGERARVTNILDANAAVPYTAQYWSSIYDVVYRRRDEGVWAFGDGVENLRNQEVFAVINRPFTDTTSVFYLAVKRGCATLTPGASSIELYRCAREFWDYYR